MSETRFKKQIGDRARRMKTARSGRHRVWLGIGLAGALGWVVAIPMVGGLFLGRWLDLHLRTGRSFTLGLLMVGLFAGVYSVWRFFLRDES